MGTLEQLPEPQGAPGNLEEGLWARALGIGQGECCVPAQHHCAHPEAAHPDSFPSGPQEGAACVGMSPQRTFKQVISNSTSPVR